MPAVRLPPLYSPRGVDSFNVPSGLKPGDFHHRGLTFQPGRRAEWFHFVPSFNTGDFTLARTGSSALPTAGGATAVQSD
jgi:hypothetical protein